MIKLLSIILLTLLLLIGGKRGLKTFFAIYVNLFLLMILVIITGWGFNPTIPTLIICIIISTIILFFLNGVNKKTIASFISVILILVLFTIITLLLGKNIMIKGYSEETIDGIGWLVYNTGLNMLAISNSVLLIGMIGTINDTSIAISSALYEVHDNNPKLTPKELFKSGMNIGKDILGTTTNTLFFAYLGGFMSLFIYFIDFKFNFTGIINSKIFGIEFAKMMLGGASSILIIPLTSFITTIFCKIDSIDKEKLYEKIRHRIRG